MLDARAERYNCYRSSAGLIVRDLQVLPEDDAAGGIVVSQWYSVSGSQIERD